MDYVEVEGDSIDDAIARALQSLGVSRDRVSIEILSNSSRGLFGIGGRRARVRATLRRPLALGGEEPAQDGQQQSAPAVMPPPPEQAPPALELERPPLEDRAPLEGAALDRARLVLQELVNHIGSTGRVEVEPDTEGPRLVIQGDESGILIGRRGQTLDALEYLVNRIVARDDETTARLIVDSQNYRSRRRDSLTALARRVAERARKRGKTVTLNPMSPRDRRIVHLALRDDPSLTTRSAGKGYFRKLLIIPNPERRRDRHA